jgi:hypothetical protein
MEQGMFEVWKEERLVGELNVCERPSRRDDWAYKLLQLVIILISSLITTALCVAEVLSRFHGRYGLCLWVHPVFEELHPRGPR